MSDPRSRDARSFPIEPNRITCRAGVVAVQDGAERPRVLDAHASYSAVKKRATLASGKDQNTSVDHSVSSPGVHRCPRDRARLAALVLDDRWRTMPHARDRPQRRPRRVLRALAAGGGRRVPAGPELGQPRLRLPRQRPEHDAGRGRRGRRPSPGDRRAPQLPGSARLRPHPDGVAAARRARRRPLPTRGAARHLPRRGRRCAT